MAESLSRLPQWLSWLFACLLVVYIAWQMASLTWMVTGYSPEIKALQTSSEPSSDTRPTSGVSRPPPGLFGSVVKKQPEKPKQKPPKAPKTRLNIRLKGVVTSDVPDQSGAIVEEPNRQSSYYKVGQTLPGKAELVAVFEDRILLRRSGREEILKFEERVTENRGRSPVKRSAAVARGQPRENRIESAEDFVEEAERRVGENPQAALSSVGLKMVQPGQAKGYVFNGRNPMLTKLNLRKGDIIRSVNGHPLGNVQKDRKLIRELYNQGYVSVEVERDGTFFSVDYPLK
ncbi:MAG: general secretion pathway protein GspC [Gammaproteobacteria bacterium]|nr:MAG: general secretion pathway protein GspC [Gammaproteobacteria bacterium]